MSWLRLDDGFAEHPKIISLGSPERRLAWLEVLLYCSRYRTGGKIRREHLHQIVRIFDQYSQETRRKRAVDGLVDIFVSVGVLDAIPDEEDSFVVHDWAEYQPKDPTAADRMRRHRAEHDRNENRNESVTSRARAPVPSLEITTLSSELQDVTRPPTEAEVVQAREQRVRSGWVDNLSSYTGCRYVRGEHSIAAVHDPLGVERPPEDWPHPRPTRQEIVAALAERQELEAG